MKFNFLRQINEYTKAYKDHPYPVAICDLDFHVYWHNRAARNDYPQLTDTGLLSALLNEYDLPKLRATVLELDSCVLADIPPFSGRNLSILPLWAQDEVIGLILLAFNTVAPQPAQHSKTIQALDKSIRESVSNIFSALDSAAMKADMLQSQWIKESLNSVSIDCYRILRLSRNISTYAAFQGGMQTMNFLLEDVREMLQDEAFLVREIGREMSIPIEFEAPGAACFVRADLPMLELVVGNLLHNALYFTRPGNEILVCCKKSDWHVELRISDRGMGIPERVLPQVFQPYFFYDHEWRGAGIGLGLAIAKLIVEAHQGTIAVDSTAGEGTTVSVRLPLASISTNTSLGQSAGEQSRITDRFSILYVSINDAVDSPYRTDREIGGIY